MNNEILKGLSIEELEERAEFTAVAADFSAEQLAEMQDAVDSGQYRCVICRC